MSIFGIVHSRWRFFVSSYSGVRGEFTSRLSLEAEMREVESAVEQQQQQQRQEAAMGFYQPDQPEMQTVDQVQLIEPVTDATMQDEWVEFNCSKTQIPNCKVKLVRHGDSTVHQYSVKPVDTWVCVCVGTCIFVTKFNVALTQKWMRNQSPVFASRKISMQTLWTDLMFCRFLFLRDCFSSGRLAPAEETPIGMLGIPPAQLDILPQQRERPTPGVTPGSPTAPAPADGRRRRVQLQHNIFCL